MATVLPNYNIRLPNYNISALTAENSYKLDETTFASASTGSEIRELQDDDDDNLYLVPPTKTKTYYQIFVEYYTDSLGGYKLTNLVCTIIKTTKLFALTPKVDQCLANLLNGLTPIKDGFCFQRLVFAINAFVGHEKARTPQFLNKSSELVASIGCATMTVYGFFGRAVSSSFKGLTTAADMVTDVTDLYFSYQNIRKHTIQSGHPHTIIAIRDRHNEAIKGHELKLIGKASNVITAAVTFAGMAGIYTASAPVLLTLGLTSATFSISSHFWTATRPNSLISYAPPAPTHADEHDE